VNSTLNKSGWLRSFARINGRLNQSQHAILNQGGYGYILPHDQPVTAWAHVFGNTHPVVCDVGFGMGHLLLAWAKQHPDINFVGVDVYRPGAWWLVCQLKDLALTNLKFYTADVFGLLADIVPRQGFHTLTCMFPDPWPKQRQQKRRMCLQPPFVQALIACLEADGYWYVSTDVVDYARDIEQLLKAEVQLAPIQKHPWLQGYGLRPASKYEQFGLRKGHDVHDLYYQKRRESNE
jgi:tRNA (guanine-N7-)-methyltransferase